MSKFLLLITKATDVQAPEISILGITTGTFNYKIGTCGTNYK